MDNTQTTSKSTKLKLDFKDSKYATGRRKTSIAKVWLKKGSGKIFINGKNYNDYFTREKSNGQLASPSKIKESKKAIARIKNLIERKYNA